MTQPKSQRTAGDRTNWVHAEKIARGGLESITNDISAQLGAWTRTHRGMAERCEERVKYATERSPVLVKT